MTTKKYFCQDCGKKIKPQRGGILLCEECLLKDIKKAEKNYKNKKYESLQAF